MKRLVGRIVYFILLIGGTAVLALLVLDILIMPYLVDVAKVRVPELRGLSADQARRELDRMDLRLAISDSVFHEDLAVGIVVSQTPPGSTQVKKGRRVAVDVSAGRRLYPVPDVGRVSRREASLQLEASQLRLGEVEFAYSPVIPQGAVIHQTPRPGVGLPRGSMVDLTISKGAPPIHERPSDLERPSPEAGQDTLGKGEEQ